MDSELLCGMENFELIWKRVRGEEAPQCATSANEGQDILRGYMDEKYTLAMLYGKLATCCREPMAQGTLLRLQRTEKRHFRCLQLEYFLLTGQCYRPVERCIRIEGFLQGLRQAWLMEKESAQNLQNAAVPMQQDTLRENLLCLAQEDARHTAEVYALLKRCMVG